MKKKYKVIKTISNHMGTLYKDEVVTLVEESLEGGFRVRDATGRLWVVSENLLKEKAPILKEDFQLKVKN